MTQKYNEFINEDDSWKDDYIIGRNVFTGDHGILQDNDFLRVHRTGRRVYCINRDFELVEVKSKYELLYKTRKHLKFTHIFFIVPEFAEKMKPLLNNLKELQELHEEKISTMIQMTLAQVNEFGDKQNTNKNK